MIYYTNRFFAICFSAGLPSYVTQEEFSRFNSFWWRPVQPSPANRESAGTGRKFTLLYEVVDDSNVDVLRFPVAGSTDVEEFRFPQAGSNNSLSRLRIVQVGLKAMLIVRNGFFDQQCHLIKFLIMNALHIVTTVWCEPGKQCHCGCGNICLRPTQVLPMARISGSGGMDAGKTE